MNEIILIFAIMLMGTITMYFIFLINKTYFNFRIKQLEIKEAKKNSNAKKRDKNITIKKEVKKNESCL